MNSPGNMPTSLGNTLDCGCHTGPWWGVTPPPKCAKHGGVSTVCGGTIAPFSQTFTSTFGVTRLSDDDVERVAKRAAELVIAALRKDEP